MLLREETKVYSVIVLVTRIGKENRFRPAFIWDGGFLDAT